MKPIDYLYVGGHKCGSTWLHDMITQHPNVLIPSKKEPFFFDDWYKEGFEKYHMLWGKEHGLRGEFSTRYFASEKTIKKIYKYNPKLKILISIRDPIDRICSHYSHQIRLNPKRFKDINDFIAKTPESLDWSMFGKNVENVKKYFPDDQIFIVNFSRISDDPSNLISEIYDFLELNDFTPSGLNVKTAAGFNPRFKIFEQLRQTLFNILYSNNQQKLISIIRKSGITRVYRFFNSKKATLPVKLRLIMIYWI